MSLTVLDTSKLIINGQAASSAYADLHAAIESAVMKETITGASTLTLNIKDAKGILRQSPVLKEYATAVLDGAGFTLCQVSRGERGSPLKVVFEDMAVRALRKHTTYRKVAASTTSRVGFVQLLIKEEPWIVVNAAPGALAKVELARGSANPSTSTAAAGGSGGGLGDYGLDPKAGAAIKLAVGASSTKKKATATDRKVAAGAQLPEDTWEAAQRIMGEINWRVYALRKVITIAPDSWILTHGTSYALTDSSPGVIDIEWDWDVGKPAASATLTVTCGTTTSMPVGSRVTLSEQGPADGDWLVETIERSDRTNIASVELIRPLPVLAEPDATSALGNIGDPGFGDTSGLDTPAGGGAASSVAAVEAFVQAALAQKGKPYVWGASGPNSFDCSGLVQWAYKQVLNDRDANGFLIARDAHDRRGDYPKPVGSMLAISRAAGAIMTVQQAIATRGALLIRGPNEHIAISLGNGQTIEARGKAYGVGVFPAIGRNWTTGAWAPGLRPAITNGRDGSRGD